MGPGLLNVYCVILFASCITHGTWVTESESSLCHVSSQNDALKNGFHGYPGLFRSTLKPEDYFNCTFVHNRQKKEKQIFPCYQSSVTDCPITRKHFEIAARRFQWNVSDSICRLQEAIFLQTNINIVYIGGSVAFGVNAGGCICNEYIDSRCRFDPSKLLISFQGQEESKLCTWGYALYRWFKGMFKDSTKVHFYDFSRSATSSGASAENLPFAFAEHNLRLTSSDLVLIEHSVNDNFKPKNFFENLIVSIFEHSKINSYPTIIAMASDIGNGYQNVYEEIGRYYNLYMLSRKDLVENLNDNSVEVEKMSDIQKIMYQYEKYIKRMLYSPDPRFRTKHFTWNVHLGLCERVLYSFNIYSPCL